MRQLADDEVVPPLEPIGDLPAKARDLLEERGIEFQENTEFDEPGPTQWAVVALDDGAQFLIVHHYGHPERFVELRGQRSTATPTALCHRFAQALGIDDGEFLHIESDWLPRPGADLPKHS